MNALIAAFGIVISLVGLFAILSPGKYLRLVSGLKVTIWIRLVSFTIRVALGLVLFFWADETQFPVFIRIVGLLMIAAGSLAIVLSDCRIQKLLDWVTGLAPKSIRIGGVGAIMFGGLMIYAGL